MVIGRIDAPDTIDNATASRVLVACGGNVASSCVNRYRTTMWICQNCRETNEDLFGTCWNCGTTQAGVPDPSFQKVVDPAAEPPTSDGAAGDMQALSVRDVLGFVAVVALFALVFQWSLYLTRGDRGLSVWVAVAGFSVVLWWCNAARCTGCGRWWGKRRTGAYGSVRGWLSSHREEFECKQCGHTEWRRRFLNK